MRALLVIAFVVTLCLPAPGATPDDNPYIIGEQLRYDMYWGLIRVGEGRYETSLVEDADGRPLILLLFTANSRGIANALYKVDSRVEVYLDPDTRLPVRLIKKLREGDHECDDVLTFDRTAGVARWIDRLDGTEAEYAILPDTRDAYSMMYEIRTGITGKGDEMLMSIASDDALRKVRIRAEKEKVVKASDGSSMPGMFLAIEALTEGLFVRKVPESAWITRDAPRLLLEMKVKTPMGRVKMVLDAAGSVEAAQASAPTLRAW